MNVVYWAKMRLARAEITEALEAVPGCELQIVESTDALFAALPGAEALVLPDAPPDLARAVTDALSAPGATVRWMHFLTAGREGFDEAGLPPGVAATYPRGAVAPTVAEHAVTLLLALTRRVPAILAAQDSRTWDRVGVSAGAGTLEDGTLAILGYGAIGREIALRARPFGPHIIGVSRSLKSDTLLDEAKTFDDLPEVLGKADFIALSAALTAETRHLIDAASLAQVKSGARLVNAARGGLVDQAALSDALRSGKLAGAALDAQTPEPLPEDDPLWDAPNLIVSPHFAGAASAASRRRLAVGAAENLRRLMSGKPLENRVQ